MRSRVVVLTTVAVLISGLAQPAQAGTTAEKYLLGVINSARGTVGKKMLAEHGSMLTEARKHSDAMADRSTMSHSGFYSRETRIRKADSGINGGICENVAYARGYDTTKEAMRVIYRVWKDSSSHNKCMFDRQGYSAESAAVGLEKRGETWWATFIVAHDANP